MQLYLSRDIQSSKTVVPVDTLTMLLYGHLFAGWQETSTKECESQRPLCSSVFPPGTKNHQELSCGQSRIKRGTYPFSAFWVVI